MKPECSKTKVCLKLHLHIAKVYILGYTRVVPAWPYLFKKVFFRYFYKVKFHKNLKTGFWWNRKPVFGYL